MLRNSLIRELSFKANFLPLDAGGVLWFVGQIVFFSIIFGNVDRIGDWTNGKWFCSCWHRKRMGVAVFQCDSVTGWRRVARLVLEKLRDHLVHAE